MGMPDYHTSAQCFEMIKEGLEIGILQLLVLAALALAFMQYQGLAFDGDLAPISQPSAHYTQVLSDPFGIDAITNENVYAGAGRFFSHWWLKTYFDALVPSLQNIVSPVDSLYMSASLFRLLAHLLFALIVAKIILDKGNFKQYLLTLLFVLPFIQIGAFRAQMGIVDISVTYTAFYAWPLVVQLWWWSPFLRAWVHGRRPQLGPLQIATRVILALPLCLSGGLVSPTNLILCGSLVLNYLLHHRYPFKKVHISYRELGLLALIFICSVYAFWVSRYNSENFPLYKIPSLTERYALLGQGLLKQLSTSLALPLLLSAIAFHRLLAKNWLPRSRFITIKKAYRFAAIFSLTYLLLLPFGGYRDYRTHIIRADTQIPITVAAILLATVLAYQLWTCAPSKYRRYYRVGWVAFLLLFVNADWRISSSSECEYQALHTLTLSDEAITVFSKDCPVLGWNTFHSPEESESAAIVLNRWGLTDSLRLFVHTESPR